MIEKSEACDSVLVWNQLGSMPNQLQTASGMAPGGPLQTAKR